MLATIQSPGNGNQNHNTSTLSKIPVIKKTSAEEEVEKLESAYIEVGM